MQLDEFMRGATEFKRGAPPSGKDEANFYAYDGNNS